MDEERLMKVVMLEALKMGVKVKWMQNFGGKFEDVWMGWNEFRGIALLHNYACTYTKCND